MLTGSPSSHVPWAADWHVCEWQKNDARYTGHEDQSISIFSYATCFPSIHYKLSKAEFIGVKQISTTKRISQVGGGACLFNFPKNSD